MEEQSANTETKQKGKPAGKAVVKVERAAEGRSENCVPAQLSELGRHPKARSGFLMTLLAPGRHLGNEGVKQLLSMEAVDVFSDLAPADAIERLLSMLAAGVSSASMDCLMRAAAMSSEHLEARDLNLRHGLKGAAVAAELIQALDAKRGTSVPREVKVRDVNVQAGAQAIIGNVEAPRRKSRSGLNSSEPRSRDEGPELEEKDG